MRFSYPPRAELSKFCAKNTSKIHNLQKNSPGSPVTVHSTVKFFFSENTHWSRWGWKKFNLSQSQSDDEITLLRVEVLGSTTERCEVSSATVLVWRGRQTRCTVRTLARVAMCACGCQCVSESLATWGMYVCHKANLR